MNLGISKKVIFSTFLFFNIIQPAKSAGLQEINKRENYPTYQQDVLKILDNEKSTYISSNINSGNTSVDTNYPEMSLDATASNLSEKQISLEIESDKQYELNNVIYAEGNVSVLYKGKLLKADNLIYDKSNKRITAIGNILLIFGDQVFKVSKLEYSFISEKGYLLNVSGSINTNTLMEDLSSNFSILDYKKIESLSG